MQTLAAGGFKDITRIASSNPKMWENIILSNKEIVKSTLNKFTETINTFIEYIDNENSNGIYNFFDSAKKFRDSIPTTGKDSLNRRTSLL